MIKRFVGLCSLVLLFACGSQERAVEGNGTIVEDQRPLEGFSAIEVEGSYTIELAQGEPAVTIETDENLLPLILTEVKGNTLVLRNSQNIKGSDGVNVRITYPELDRLEIGGSANITNVGTLEGRNLEVVLSGAGLVDLGLEVRKLELDLSGASSVNLRGTAQQLDASLSGAGHLDANELQVRDAAVNLSGIGNADVYVTDNLQAKVSGVGSISYKGEPANIQRQVSGVGSIKAAGAN